MTIINDPVVDSIIKSEEKRQRSVLRLIASENTISHDVAQALGSVFSNKYAEGYPQKRYYQGQANNDAIESLAIQRAKDLFGAEHANVQPYSGSPANMAAYFALCNPGDKIVGLGLNSGGHLTHGWKVNFSGKLYEPHQCEVDPETELLDLDALDALCQRVKPRVLFIGTTSYSRAFDFKTLAEIAKKHDAYFVADIAHVAGLIAAGAYPTPVPHADVVTLTTHKSLRGPRGGLILCKEEFAKAIDRAVFPGLQGGPHMNQIAALAVALNEAKSDEFKKYAFQVVKNAQTLAQALAKHGLRIVAGGTDCHLIVVDLSPKNIGGKTAAIALEKAGIVCNFNAVPYDKRPPRNPSGIRLGTPSLTTRGFKEAEMQKVADWMIAAIQNHENDEKLANIASEIAKFLDNFD
ncbi:MAG: serine hydroxymethyltransferase [Bradymonadales bacterium]